MNNSSPKQTMTSAQMADKERLAAEKRGTRKFLLLVALMLGLFVFIEHKNPGFFGDSQREQAHKRAVVQQVRAMDCNAAMKMQADLVIAGKGVQARELTEAVESACTPTSDTVIKVLLVLLVMFGGLGLFVMSMFGRLR